MGRRSTRRSCSGTSPAHIARSAVSHPLLRRLRLGPAPASAHGRRRDSPEAGADPGEPSTLGELAHLALAVRRRRTGCARRGRAAGGARPGERRTRARPPSEPVSEERLEGYGRARAERRRRARHRAHDLRDDADRPAAAAQDRPRVGGAPAAATLLLGPLLMAADGLARLRRRRERRRELGALGAACALPFLRLRPVRARARAGSGIIRAAPPRPSFPARSPSRARRSRRSWRSCSCWRSDGCRGPSSPAGSG